MDGDLDLHDVHVIAAEVSLDVSGIAGNAYLSDAWVGGARQFAEQPQAIEVAPDAFANLAGELSAAWSATKVSFARPSTAAANFDYRHCRRGRS